MAQSREWTLPLVVVSILVTVIALAIMGHSILTTAH